MVLANVADQVWVAMAGTVRAFFTVIFRWQQWFAELDVLGSVSFKPFANVAKEAEALMVHEFWIWDHSATDATFGALPLEHLVVPTDLSSRWWGIFLGFLRYCQTEGEL